jgi:hypothetical protein
MGAILVPGRRTVASALRVMGLEQGAQFSNYHRVLNRNIWSSRWLSRRLFRLLVDPFVPSGDPVVTGLDDTIERRWGGRSKHVASIETRSVLRTVTSLRRAAALALAHAAARDSLGRAVLGTPVLTVLAPSERYWQQHQSGKRQHKKLTDWGQAGPDPSGALAAAPADRRRWRHQLSPPSICSMTCGRG